MQLNDELFQYFIVVMGAQKSYNTCLKQTRCQMWEGEKPNLFPTFRVTVFNFKNACVDV